MTTANKITILRILLIPFFVVEVLYYVKTGTEGHRIAALLCFAVAAIFDGVDGYVARRFHQKTELGAVLDPLADKLLLVSAVVLLSFDHTPHFEAIPLWLTPPSSGGHPPAGGLGGDSLMVGRVQCGPASLASWPPFFKWA